MNNLKFKVYNVHAEEFVHDGSEVTIFNMVSWAKYCYTNGFSDVSHLRCLFFTELFDKYGREICEGDIVKIDSLFHKNAEEVTFKNGSFGFIPNYESLTRAYGRRTDGDDFEPLGLYFSLEREVIGNIFNDSHLLK